MKLMEWQMSGGEGGMVPVAHYEGSATRGPPSEKEQLQQLLQEGEDEEYDEVDEVDEVEIEEEEAVKRRSDKTDDVEDAGASAGVAVKIDTDNKKN